MATIDLNLLAALDVLLAERSVTGAARRLGLSPSAMSRTLARLRKATGDPLLVQAGRTLVATPHAETLTARVRIIAHEARQLLTPAEAGFDPAALDRSFTIRANEGFTARFAGRIIAAVTAAAPRVHLRFAPKPDKGAAPLRDGRIDLEIGTTGTSAPEMRTHLLFRDRFVGAVRQDHPLMNGPVTAARYAACAHVVTSRRGVMTGPVDAALADIGLHRQVVATVPGFLDAAAIVRGSALVATLPLSCFQEGGPMFDGITWFNLPVSTPDLAISVVWHPRLDADSPHRWMRETVIAATSSPKLAMS